MQYSKVLEIFRKNCFVDKKVALVLRWQIEEITIGHNVIQINSDQGLKMDIRQLGNDIIPSLSKLQSSTLIMFGTQIILISSRITSFANISSVNTRISLSLTSLQISPHPA